MHEFFTAARTPGVNPLPDEEAIGGKCPRRQNFAVPPVAIRCDYLALAVQKTADPAIILSSSLWGR